MTAFQSSIRQGNRAAVATQIAYPLLWSTASGKVTIHSHQEFLARYSEIFRSSLLHAILAADPHALFCQNMTQASIGSGVIWGDVFRQRLSIITINPPVP
jgi:hypothetical protein